MATIPEKTIYDSELVNKLDDRTRSLVERPVLVMLDGSDVNSRYFMDKPELIIGRDRICDITLHDSRSSRRHARLEYLNFEDHQETPKIRISDAGSTNGVIVNGSQVEEYFLNDRDKILIGSTLFGFFLRDESELAAEEHLYHLANNDALTNLRNRHLFNDEIRKEFDRAKRYKRDLSLVMFDIDNFKQFNDTYGHQMGDYVLQELGVIVQANVRSNDIGARYGGEEFAIILPETSLEGSLIQAERLRQSVEQHPYSCSETKLIITVSVGISSMEECIRTCDELIKAADDALYAAKRNGRNCVSWNRDGKSYFGVEVP
jgi:two-component system cell cycle response regulator